MQLFVDAVRETAAENSRVGKDLLLAISSADAMWAGLKKVSQGGVLTETHVCDFLPDGPRDQFAYRSPWMVADGQASVWGAGTKKPGPGWLGL